MSDPMDRLVNIEEQRARMKGLLNDAGQAMMVTLDPETKELAFSYMNCNAIDILGMTRALNDHAPMLAAGQGIIGYVDPDDEDDEELDRG